MHSLTSDSEPRTNQTGDAASDARRPSDTISDEEAACLWAEFLGDANPRGLGAFERLYDHFLPTVFRFCRSRLRDVHLAEDVAHTVFVRLMESRPTIRTSFIGLLLVTARNLCATELAARHRSRMMKPELLDADAAEPGHELEGRDTHAALADCLDRLPESDQTLVLLRHGEGLTHAQISDILGLRVAFSTLTRRLRAVVAKLRRCLKEKNIF
jgi:RNA polymerase sigma-70 factor, ECF subfamily